MYETLRVERVAAVARIWLERPQVHNAFNEVLVSELDHALRTLESDPVVRVLVLAGSGRSFCAGADLHWMARAAAAGNEQNLQDARQFAAMLRRLARMGKPTIARVHGLALGGGVGLAAACDICIATPEANFSMSEVRLGLIPAVIGPYVVRAIGARQALRYVQSAERISAAHALELGLVHETVAAEDLDARIAAICAALCAGGPQSLAAAKSLLLELDGAVIDDELVEKTARAIALQRSTAEAREGIGAFLGKRRPAWTLVDPAPLPAEPEPPVS